MFESKKATEALDRANAALSVAHLAMLNAIREVDRCDAWIDEGARDLTHWLSMRYDITTWKARRWIGAANAMPGLPRLARALASGRLGIDKVVELARFVTPADEGRWLSWAEGVSARTIRRRGDVVSRELHGDASQAMSDHVSCGGTRMRAASRSRGRCPARRVRWSPTPWIGSPKRCRSCRVKKP